MSQPARPAPAAGAVLSDPLAGSKYRALRELGKGGWGVVYEAEHVDLRRRFAVKVLLPNFARDAMSVQRMRVEAQALGQLHSRHIVEVSDFGHTEDGRPFFVMPLLKGHTLLVELRQRGCLPPEEAVGLVQQLLAGSTWRTALGSFTATSSSKTSSSATMGEGSGCSRSSTSASPRCFPALRVPNLPGFGRRKGRSSGRRGSCPPSRRWARGGAACGSLRRGHRPVRAAHRSRSLPAREGLRAAAPGPRTGGRAAALGRGAPARRARAR